MGKAKLTGLGTEELSSYRHSKANSAVKAQQVTVLSLQVRGPLFEFQDLPKKLGMAACACEHCEQRQAGPRNSLTG